MDKNIGNANVVRRISFTAAEDTVLQALAENAGMSVPAFIRMRALHGSVLTIDWKSLREHTEAINAIGEEVRWYTSNQRPNRWLFDADLQMIRECLDRLIDLEQRFINDIRKDNSPE